MWNDDQGLSDDCALYSVDGTDLLISGLDDGYCQEITASSTVVDCLDEEAINYNATANYPCWDCCEYPVAVELSISDVSYDNVVVSAVVNEDIKRLSND